MQRILALISQPAVKRLARYVQLLLVLALGLYLLNRLSDIGWSSVMAHMPAHPAFYIILIVNFTLVPASEILIYRPLWQMKPGGVRGLFAALMRKQAFNDAIVGYSGEVFLYVWARRNVTPRLVLIFDAIKDNNLLSATVSSSVALVVTLAFAFSGHLSILTAGMPDVLPYIALALGLGVMVVPVLLLFGRRIIKLPRTELARIAGLHLSRLCLFESLSILQWSLALPEVPLVTWFAFIAAKMVLTRVPLMPNKDLMLLGLAVTLSGSAGADSAALAGLFLASTALTQALNFTVFVSTSLLGRGAAVDDDAAEADLAAASEGQRL